MYQEQTSRIKGIPHVSRVDLMYQAQTSCIKGIPHVSTVDLVNRQQTSCIKAILHVSRVDLMYPQQTSCIKRIPHVSRAEQTSCITSRVISFALLHSTIKCLVETDRRGTAIHGSVPRAKQYTCTCNTSLAKHVQGLAWIQEQCVRSHAVK